MRNSHLILVASLCITAGCSQDRSGQAAVEKWELADAIPKYLPSTCMPPNPRERKLFELSASAIELVGDDNPNWLDIGAQKYLARTHYRTVGVHRIAVCTPNDVLMRVSSAFSLRKGFGKGRLVEYQLELASRLSIRDPRVVEAVGQSAFNPSVQQSEIFSHQDIRPYSRTVLASFGRQSKNYVNVAYEQMSNKNSMGTGAAQVAAAAGHPDALPRIERMMEESLSAIPADKAIPRYTRNRLYELAWAIVYSGEDGKRFTKPIHKIMKRRVESWAPPFGMVELHPKRLCEVLKRIEGANSVSPYPFCLDDKIPFEQ